ncbi:alpha/beta fold hydrolase [Streptomyces canus]|uniref:alpha/beta fold hydrolase n=1 Tax=Streptomyces canus TaxID=58343 RepID=UPI0030DE6C23
MLEGFEDRYADVNGTRLHYVIGGEGEPLVLMDGFPRTWHGLHKIMTPLAKHFRVIAVDYRGQGESDKPEGGYDKKNMAKDVYELVRSLGHELVNIAGGDRCDGRLQLRRQLSAGHQEARPVGRCTLLADIPGLRQAVPQAR